MDTKQLALADAGLKFDDADGARVFTGYASVFGGVDSYGDTIVRGAYAETLKNRDRPIRMRDNHWGPVIGKWTEIAEDDRGLLVTGELTPGHSAAENVYASLKHGAVDGLSIGYRVRDFEMVDGVRHLKRIDLVEISVVEEPADGAALISDVKQAIEACTSWKHYEGILREAGFSRGEATHLVRVAKSLSDGERLDERDGLADLVEAIKRL